MALSDPPRDTRCPVCRLRGQPPDSPSTTTLDVFRCYTSGCPVMTFHPFEPDLEESFP
jgi:hypothetical protein